VAVKENGKKSPAQQRDPITPAQDGQKPAKSVAFKQDDAAVAEKSESSSAAPGPEPSKKKGVTQSSVHHQPPKYAAQCRMLSGSSILLSHITLIAGWLKMPFFYYAVSDQPQRLSPTHRPD
jgi:hypothetical protein